MTIRPSNLSVLRADIPITGAVRYRDQPGRSRALVPRGKAWSRGLLMPLAASLGGMPSAGLEEKKQKSCHYHTLRPNVSVIMCRKLGTTPPAERQCTHGEHDLDPIIGYPSGTPGLRLPPRNPLQLQTGRTTPPMGATSLHLGRRKTPASRNPFDWFLLACTPKTRRTLPRMPRYRPDRTA